MIQGRWTRAAIVAAALALTTPATASAGTGDGVLGGPATADTGSTLCPAGVGATGVLGDRWLPAGHNVAATVKMRCRGGADAVGSMGNNSGTAGPGASQCGSGQVAVGVTGREGDFIDQIAVRCRPSDLSAAATTAPTTYNGLEGTPDGPIDCPTGQWLRGLQGSLWVTPPTIFVRNVSLSCFAPDSDGDGVPNATDNCVGVPNPGQQKLNGGLYGDACAPAPNDGRLGGAPGIETGSSVCPAGTAVTSLAGTLGLVGQNPIAASVAVRCEGGVAGTGVLGTAPGTGPGGTSCPAGQVAVGIEGREGDLLDRLALRCRTADLSGATAAVLGYGGGGGGPDGPYDCANGSRLVGLDGSMVNGDTVLRHVSIRCQPLDSDGDGVLNIADNCVSVQNPTQSDVDADGLGDPCDPVDNRPGPLPNVKPAAKPAVRIKSTVSNVWTVNSKYGLLQRLVVNNVPAGATVTIACRGKGCPFKSRRFTRKRAGKVPATKLFAQRHLGLGTVLQVRITKPGSIGRVVTFRLRKRAVPKPLVQCLPVGSARPRARC